MANQGGRVAEMFFFFLTFLYSVILLFCIWYSETHENFYS